MRYFFDTEFMEDGLRIELLSIGVVDENGRQFYAENAEADLSRANEWVIDNVVPHLWRTKRHEDVGWGRGGPAGGLMTRAEIGRELRRFVGERPEFWAYYADYDWVAICQLYGRMVDLPESWPMFCRDVKQLAVEFGDPTLPEQSSTEHHALDDALWCREAYNFVVDHARRRGDRAEAESYLELARHHLDAEHAGEALAGALRLILRDRDLWPYRGTATLTEHGVLLRMSAEEYRTLMDGMVAWEAHQWPPDRRTGP